MSGSYRDVVLSHLSFASWSLYDGGNAGRRRPRPFINHGKHLPDYVKIIKVIGHASVIMCCTISAFIISINGFFPFTPKDSLIISDF